MFLCIWLPEMVSFSVAGFGWPRKSCRQNRFTTTTAAVAPPPPPAIPVAIHHYYDYLLGSEFKVYLSEAAAAAEYWAHFPVSHIMTTTTTELVACCRLHSHTLISWTENSLISSFLIISSYLFFDDMCIICMLAKFVYENYWQKSYLCAK